MPDDLMFRPAAELAGLVRAGELSARELVTASLDRIEALEPQVNAFTHVDAEGALAAAETIGAGDERPFAGVPIAIKDNRPVEGLPLTFSASCMPDFRPPFDGFVVRRLREAGFVIVGITAMPEFGIINVTESTRNGPTRNPWELERTPGGSSGGAAAAVASGMLPLAHGNDGGGSIRIPAACCGLVGLKPARGRISQGPAIGDSFLGVDGVLTRTVRETAELLDVMAGYEVGDATWAPPPGHAYALAAQREPGTLRVGFTTLAPLEGAEVSDGVRRAVAETAELLAGLGHEVEEVTPPYAQPGLLEIFSVVYSPLISEAVAFAGRLAGRALGPEDMEALSWMLWEASRAASALDHASALTQLQGLARQIVAGLDAFDALLLPVLAETPVAIGEIDARAPDPAATFRRSGEFTPYPAVANITGQPAISLPLFEDAQGLPLAVQLMGRPTDEATLLSLATQLEAALPWSDRRAPVS